MFFSTSPILRKTYDKHPKWWNEDVKIPRDKAQTILEGKAEQEAK